MSKHTPGQVLSTIQMATFNGAAQSLSNVPVDAAGVILQAEADSVRMTADASTPAAGNGLLLYATALVPSTPITINSDPNKVKVLAVSANSKLNATFIA